MVGEKFKAVCSNCGKECEIPFNPTEGRPVKCNDCFKRNRFKKKRRDFGVICDSCGRATTVPFKPVQGKPVLCRSCFRSES